VIDGELQIESFKILKSFDIQLARLIFMRKKARIRIFA